jgi:hypothetical protein
VALLISDFVNLWKTEADGQQTVLLAHRPGAGTAESLAQPQHRLGDPPGCVADLSGSNIRGSERSLGSATSV